MSRTWKDRPYWVRCNDTVNYHPVVSHDHELVGKDIKRWFFVYDEQGEPLMKDVVCVDEMWVKDILRYDETDDMLHYVSSVYRQYERVEKRHVRELRVVGQYADYCTGNEHRRKKACDENGVFNPCVPELGVWEFRPYEGMDKEARRMFSKERRGKEKALLKKQMKRYNFGEDTRDDDNLYPGRKGDRYIWWD